MGMLEALRFICRLVESRRKRPGGSPSPSPALLGPRDRRAIRPGRLLPSVAALSWLPSRGFGLVTAALIFSLLFLGGGGKRVPCLRFGGLLLVGALPCLQACLCVCVGIQG